VRFTSTRASNPNRWLRVIGGLRSLVVPDTGPPDPTGIPSWPRPVRAHPGCRSSRVRGGCLRFRLASSARLRAELRALILFGAFWLLGSVADRSCNVDSGCAPRTTGVRWQRFCEVSGPYLPHSRHRSRYDGPSIGLVHGGPSMASPRTLPVPTTLPRLPPSHAVVCRHCRPRGGGRACVTRLHQEAERRTVSAIPRDLHAGRSLASGPHPRGRRRRVVDWVKPLLDASQLIVLVRGN